MAKQSIRLIISSLFDKTGITAASHGVASLMLNVKKMGASMKNTLLGVGRNLMNIKAGFDMVVGSVRQLGSLLSKGIEFERWTASFKVFLGSLEDAKAHMQDLQDLGRTPPFSTEEFVGASRAMLKMSDGLLGFKEDLKLVGDMAAATGSSIESVGRAFGLAYQVIRDGQDFGRAGQQLYTMGILTKKQVADLNELTKAGTDNYEVWEKFVEMTSRYSGAMEDTEQTVGGLTDAIKGELDVAMTEFSTAILDEARPALESVLQALRDFIEEGTATYWAEQIVSAFESIADAAKATGSIVGTVWDKAGLSDVWAMGKAAVGGTAGFASRAIAGWSNGEGFTEALGYANEYSREEMARQVASGHYLGELAKNGYLGTQGYNGYLDNEYEKQQDIEARERAKEKAAKARQEREEAAKKKAEEQAAKRREDMERARLEREEREHKKMEKEVLKEREKLEQRETKISDKAAKKFEAEREKERKKAEREKEKAEAKAQRDRERAERKAYRKEMDMLRGHYEYAVEKIDEQKQAVEDTITRLKAAGAENPMAMARTLDQAGVLKSKRQGEIDEARFDKARKALEEKMARNHLGLDDPDLEKKLGRLSNLEQATLERIRLDEAKVKKDKLEEQKIGLLNELNGHIESINEKMENIGL